MEIKIKNVIVLKVFMCIIFRTGLPSYLNPRECMTYPIVIKISVKLKIFAHKVFNLDFSNAGPERK